MTGWIFKSLLGSKILPHRRGMEQGYFQSLDGIPIFFAGTVDFFFFLEWKLLDLTWKIKVCTVQTM